MFVCCMLVRIFLSGFTCFVVQVLVGIIVYLGILIIFKDEFIYLIIENIREKIFNTLKKG